MKVNIILTSKYPLNKLSQRVNESVNLDDFDYDENAPAAEVADFNHLKEQAETKKNIILEFLNARLKGCDYEVMIEGMENAKSINDLKFPIEIQSVNEEDLMYIIEDINEEINGDKIILPKFIDEELLKKVTEKTSGNLLKIVKLASK